MSSDGTTWSGPNPQNNRKELKGLSKKVKKLTDASLNNLNKRVDDVKMVKDHFLLRPIMAILWITIIGYFFLRFNFTGVDFFSNALTNIFSFLKVDTVWGLVDGELWISILVLYALFVTYTDFLVLFPFTYFMSMKSNPIDNIKGQIRWEMLILIILLIPLLTTSSYYLVFGQDEDTRAHNRENFQVDSKNRWQELTEPGGGLCALVHLGNPQYCLETVEPIQSETSKRVEYDVYFVKPDFDYVENLERWKQRPLYVQYKIQAKGEPLYVEKVECYQDKMDKEHLIDTIEIDTDKQKILSNDRAAIDTIRCDLSKVTTKSTVEKNKKIIVVLYYSFEATYSQPIPVYDMDLYIPFIYGTTEGISYTSEETNLREEVKNDIKPVIPNNALELDTQIAPPLPILLGGDYEDRNQFTFKFNFKKKSNVDELISTEIIDYSLPPIFEQNCYDYDCDSIKGKLITHNDKSQIILDTLVQDPNADRIDFITNIEFRVKSSFYSKETITFEVHNPDYVEPSSESSSTSTDSSSEGDSSTSRSNPFVSLGVSSDSNGVYEYNADDSWSVSALYYKQVNGAWQWSPDKENWMSVNTYVVSGGSYNGEEPTNPNKDFIHSLR